MTLTWDRPKPVMSRDEYESISADGAPPGVYSGNMSREDAYKWRARKIGGKDPRVEIRKTISGPGKMIGDLRWGSMAQIVVIVRPLGTEAGKTGMVSASMNGTAEFSADEWAELISAVAEAREALDEPQHG